jgi:hypothetical protein
MSVFLVVVLVHDEECSTCGKTIKEGEKVTIRVYFGYKIEMQWEDGPYCQHCHPIE